MNADMAYQIVRRANAALDAQQTADAVTLMTAGAMTWREPLPLSRNPSAA